MKITNKERTQYIHQIKKLLFCSSKERKKFLKEFNDNIDDFLKDNPEASISDLQKAMGTPQEIADGFLSNADTKDLKRQTSIVRILLFGISIVVIIIAIFFITAWIDMYKNHRSHGEVTIIDNGTIYVEASTSAP